MPTEDKTFKKMTKHEVQQSIEFKEFQKRRKRQMEQQIQQQKKWQEKRPGTMHYLKKARYRPGVKSVLVAED
jgi:hypothetical protein